MIGVSAQPCCWVDQESTIRNLCSRKKVWGRNGWLRGESGSGGEPRLKRMHASGPAKNTSFEAAEAEREDYLGLG